MKTVTKIARLIGLGTLYVLDFWAMVFLIPGVLLLALVLLLKEGLDTLSFVTQERSDCVTEGEDDEAEVNE